MNNEASSIKDLHIKAQEAEKAGDTDTAIQLYKQILQQDALHTDAYNSLMKLYRRAKEYKKEMAIIDKAIKSYEAYYKKHKPRHGKAIDAISQKINKAFGLTDKKGEAVYSPEPIGTWKKRRAMVMKKMPAR